MKTVIQDDISFRLNGVDNPLNNFNFERCPLITKGTQICSSPIRSITLGNNQIYRLRATDALYQSNFVDLIFMYNSTSDILFLKSDMPMTVSKKVITTTINNIDPRVPPQIVTSSLNFISHVPTNRIGSFNERTILTIKNWHANGGGANNTVSFDINIANNISCQEVYCYLDNGTVTKLPSAASATDGSNLVISPNPVTNIAKMTLNMAEESRGDITIYDMMGRGVQNIQRNQTFYKGEHEITIDATTLQRGFYLLEVKTQTDRIVQKFVKE